MTSRLNLPPIIGHRGSAGLAPENTLVGIQRAFEEGASWVEFDVKLSADDVPILMHDERLDRTTDGKGKVASKTLPEIQALDAGAWFHPTFTGERVPTLKAALDLCIDLGLGVNVELKPCPGRARKTAEIALWTVASAWPEQGNIPTPLISSFDQQALAAAEVLSPDLPRGCLVTRVPLRWQAAVDRFSCRTLNISNRWVRKKHVDAAKDEDIPVLVYTVNEPERALALFEMGVTSIFTDQVDLMMAALRSAKSVEKVS